MKNLRLYALIVLAFNMLMFASCGSDNDKEEKEDEPVSTDIRSMILGYWCYNEGEDEDVVYLLFEPDGYYEIMTVYIDDNLNSQIESGSGTYKIEGKKLKTHVLWDGDDEYEDEVINIVSITENTLILSGDEFGGKIRLQKIRG